MTYTIVFERSEDGGWSGYAPDLPGLLLAADTREELLSQARGAVEDYLEALAERGLPQPPVGEHVVTVEVGAA